LQLSHNAYFGSNIMVKGKLIERSAISQRTHLFM
jgi:hypothetical protein